ncbi:MAG: hypothetical protein RI885_630 [Actinomycetota bacterium]|jgi:putative SOS response-associated peptidase YedK
MCGRFVVAGERRDLLGLFEIEFEGDELPGDSWNVRPTDQVKVVIETAKGGPTVRRLESARWSLVPAFAPSLKTKAPTFNARSESAAEKPFFAKAVRSARAIIPASGYYEWKTEGGVKTPHYVHAESGMIAFAGLYSWWRDRALADDDPVRWHLTTTILTRDAVGALADIHPRTPVTLPPQLWKAWLDPDTLGDAHLVEAAVAASLPEAEQLVITPVAPIGNVDHAGLIEPL